MALAGTVLAVLFLEQGHPRSARADVAARTTGSSPAVRPIGGTGVFGPGERPRFTVSGVDRSADVTWRVTDVAGAVVDSGPGRTGVESVEVHTATDLASGIYRLTVQPTGTTAVSVRFVRTVDDPSTSDPFFALAVNGSPGPAASALPTLAALGAGSYRQDLQWGTVEKVPGRFDFGTTDARVDPIVRDLGVSPLFVLDYGHMSYTGGAMTPPDVSDPAQAAGWSRFVRESVTHMRARYPDADLSYEVWNEWTNTHGPLPSTPAAYIELAALTATVIRAADPAATIVGPTQNSVSVTERAWLAEWFRAGGAEHVDAVSVHPYNQPYAPEHCVATNPCIEDSLAWLRRTADANPRSDGTSLPIWITETGWPTRYGGSGWVSEDDQTAFVLRTAAIAAQYGVERLFLFEMAEPDRPDPNGLDRTFGLTRAAAAGYEPKPSAAAWVTMQRLLAGKRFVGEYRTGDVREVRFSSPDGAHHVRMVWQTSDRLGATSVRVGLPGVGRLVEPTGTEKPVRGTDGKLAMSAKWIPRFVVWDD